MAFQKATRTQKKARLALYGPSGSGKTYTALSIATGLGNTIALVDTERGSASLYADKFNFDTLELSNFHPDRFIEAIHDAAKSGYDVLVIDSLSHAWQGTGGILDKVNAAGGNSYTDGWGKIGTPLYNKLMDAILDAPLHIIACMRSKTDTVMEKNKNGKDAPRKVGTAPVMRQDSEYEFDYVGLLDNDNTMSTQKTRMGDTLPDSVNRPNKATGAKILTWLTSGAAQKAPPPAETISEIQQRARTAENMRDKSDIKSEVPFGEKEVAAKLGGTVRTEPPAPATAESLAQRRVRLNATLKALREQLSSAGMLDALKSTEPAGNESFAATEAKIAAAQAALTPVEA